MSYCKRHEHRKTTEETPMRLRIRTLDNKLVGTAGTFRSFAYIGRNTTKEDAKRAIHRDFTEHNKRIGIHNG